jgi:hypothetical protein
MPKIIKILMIIFLLAVGSVVLLISQLYSSVILLAGSYSLLLGSIGLGLRISRRLHRFIISFIMALLINANYISYIPYGNPVITMILYGMGLLIAIWAILVGIAETVAIMASEKISSRW